MKEAKSHILFTLTKHLHSLAKYFALITVPCFCGMAVFASVVINMNKTYIIGYKVAVSMFAYSYITLCDYSYHL